MDNVKIGRIVKQFNKNAAAIWLIKDIAAGLRVFYGVDQPSDLRGWVLIERHGLAVRTEGTDRAELTDTGRAVVQFMKAQNPEGMAL